MPSNEGICGTFADFTSGEIMTNIPNGPQITFMYTICLCIRVLQLAVVKTKASNAALLEMIAQLNSAAKSFGADADSVMAQFNMAGHAIILDQMIMIHGLPPGIAADWDKQLHSTSVPESTPTFH